MVVVRSVGHCEGSFDIAVASGEVLRGDVLPASSSRNLFLRASFLIRLQEAKHESPNESRRPRKRLVGSVVVLMKSACNIILTRRGGPFALSILTAISDLLNSGQRSLQVLDLVYPKP